MLTRRLPVAGAICAAAALTAQAAGAHSGHAFTVYDPGTTLSLTFGAYEPDFLTFDFPAGWRFAHDDQYGNELASNPNDEEVIGSGTRLASWTLLFCGTSTLSTSLTWEEDMTGAPAGAVAHYTLTTASTGNTEIWVIEQDDAVDDYKLTMDLDPNWTCATQPAGAEIDLTVHQTVSAFGRVVHDPPGYGCMWFSATFIDVGGTSHSGSAQVALGGASC